MTTEYERPSPIEDPDAWNTVTLAGVRLPGVAKVSGCGEGYEWDKKKAKGAKGSTITYKSDELREPTIELSLWLPEHFEAWHNEAKPLLRKPTDLEEPIALDVAHPDFEDADIASVVVQHVDQLEDDGTGLHKTTIKLLEFRPPEATGGTPSGSATTAWGVAVSGAEAAVEAVENAVETITSWF